jgi:hypothetical protein
MDSGSDEPGSLQIAYIAGVLSGNESAISGREHPEQPMTLRQLLQWQWNGYQRAHLSRANLAIHVITVPMFVLGTTAIACSIVTLSPRWALGGALAMGSAMALQGLGHRLEPNAPAPFTGIGNMASRIFLEQWVTFPRYLLSGAWRQRGGACR